MMMEIMVVKKEKKTKMVKLKSLLMQTDKSLEKQTLQH